MASHRYSRYTTSSNHANYQTEESESHQRRHYSRYTDSEEPPPRRRRWAAGYIDSRSCPSYDYIDRRPKQLDGEDEHASDVEYIHPQTNRNNDYVESQTHRGSGASRSRARYGREWGTPQQQQQQEQQQPGRASERLSESEMEEHPDSDTDIQDMCNRSPRHRIHTPQTPPPISPPASVSGSDILTASLELGSDVISLRSGRSSPNQPSRRSARSRSASEASYVQLRRKEGASSESESDDDGDYISLDEYIAGRSDCDSIRGVEGDEGEGSDAVGSDVEVRSDVGEGSDVASVGESEGYDSEDDCIEEGCGGNYGSYVRR